MKFVRISSAVIGSLMIIQWVFFLVTGNVPELNTTPVSIIFHICIENITAVILIYGAFLCKKWAIRQTVLLYGQGMIGYTVVNSAGYFAQSGDWLFVGMFAILLGISVYNAVLLYKQRNLE